jgi:predicted NBD/HSP70 family sugar kinase
MKDKKTANLSIQRINRTNVYRLLRQQEGLTRQDIVHQLQLSLPTVVQNISDLQREGLVRENGFIGNTGGRKAMTYSIVKDARTAIGLDITQHNIIAVTVDLTGEIIGQKQESYNFECSDKYYRKLGAVIKDLVKETALDEKHILGIGFGLPGLATADHQTIFYGEILKCTGATCKEFSKYIPYKAALFNDAKAACFAELWIRRNPGNAFYIMLSNNVGGAVVINNQMYMGGHYHSAEIGHVTLVPKGRLCYCGQRGCADPYLAGTVLSSLSNGDLAEFFRRLEQKDNAAEKAWDTYLDHLALAVNYVEALYDCTIILGGYVGEYMEKYIDEIKRRAVKLSTFEKNADYLDVCRYKTNSIAAGAALNFIAAFHDSI